MFGSETQSIDNQDLNSFEESQLTIVNGFHVGYIHQVAQSISKYREFVVHDLNWHDINTSYTQVLMRHNHIKPYLRHSWIFMFTETIWNRMAQPFCCFAIRIQIDTAKRTKRAQVVNSSYMVIMHMGQQYCIELAKLNA